LKRGADPASPEAPKEVNVNRTHVMTGSGFMAGMLAGIALAFVMDPVSGRRRRALIRDKMTRAGNATSEAAEGAAIDLSNRARGIAAEAQSAVRQQPVDDGRLVERVRSELGRATSHPRSIKVMASGGIVTLSGPVLADEADQIMQAARRVNGVHAVSDQLERHATPDIPALQ
jgi:osmotically-inducible protein OsmY